MAPSPVEPSTAPIAAQPAAAGIPDPVAAAVAELAAELAAVTTRPWTLMEVCGGQTHAILRWGLDQLLPPGLRLIHGPGCPVCVTPAATLDAAQALARRPEVILCSYGDMLRVPGSGGSSLLTARAAGADVRLITAPIEALELARAHPRRQVVMLAVGFETTAPATALLARRALAEGLANLAILTAHVRVAPAMEALLAPETDPAAAPAVQGFLAAGHVCAVVGTDELRQRISARGVPVVVTGFEPLDLLRGVLACVRQLEAGQAALLNAYPRAVREGGNPAARALLEEVFAVVDRPWRGLGMIAGGGLALRGPFAALEARRRFGLPEDEDRAAAAAAPAPATATATATATDALAVAAQTAAPAAAASAAVPAAAPTDPPPPAPPLPQTPPPADRAALADNDPGDDPCIAGAILRGRALPSQCPAFGRRCTPEHPLGAPMVSSEGACAAYHRYRSAPKAP
jgi:hydrogenase expression/formation protein HypD